VVWEFRDPAFEKGLRISFASFAAILLMYLVPWLLARRRRPAAAAEGGA